jgi:2-keto-4-pentenoate hydratase/2-oxohepta-3-ene-1,7-dioic acid hydratase in catechol pathway
MRLCMFRLPAGRPGRVPAGDAEFLAPVPAEWYEFPAFYFTVMNDWSARDIQRKEMRIGLGPAKAKDFATSLGPGDVLGSGTVGTGCVLEHDDGRWLVPGDLVELEVAGLGVLANRVAPPREPAGQAS